MTSEDVEYGSYLFNNYWYPWLSHEVKKQTDMAKTNAEHLGIEGGYTDQKHIF